MKHENYDIYIISTFPPRKCGIATFTENLVSALGEKVNSINIGAIESKSESHPYPYPVIKDWIINQGDPNSWRSTAHKISSSASKKRNPVVILQHEFGLDSGPPGSSGDRGKSFVDVSRLFKQSGITTVTYLHTIKPKPEKASKKELEGYKKEARLIKELSNYNDGLVVTAQGAIDILSSEDYGIPPQKVEHIPHGTRDFSHKGRDETKERYGLEGKLIFSTVGMKGPKKGITDAIRGWGEFLNSGVSKNSREKLAYIVAGGYHPNYIAENKGKNLKQFQEEVSDTISQYNLKSETTNNPNELGKLASKNDVVFLEPALEESYIPEDVLVDMFSITNAMVLAYRNKDQISSGPLSDALGSGRVTIATKFPYAHEMLNPSGESNEGIIGISNDRSRGLLVDNDAPDYMASPSQLAECFDHITYNNEARIGMEQRAYLKGLKMRWPEVGSDFLRYVDFLEETKNHGCGKDPIFSK